MALIEQLWDVLEYDNMVMDEKGDFGLLLTTKSREVVLSDLEEKLRSGRIRVNSSRTVDELLTFIIKEDTGKVQADDGYNDDLVMSLALAAHTMDELYKGSPEPLTSDPNDDKSYAMPVISTKYSQDEDIQNYHKWMRM
jgi:hypothetical protein